MYIENKLSKKYLVKKVGGKKIHVGISYDEKISIPEILTITEKEFDITKSDREYQLFKDNLYNPQLLDDVIFQSIFIGNQIQNGLFENLSLNKKYNDFPIKFIYESNKTEGSRIPFESVEEIVKNRKYAYKVKNEIIEVENSMKVWKFINEKFVFNSGNIKKMYHLLTRGLLQENGLKYPRGYKKTEIVVNNHGTTPPENVDREIENLIIEYKKNQKTTFPLKLAFDFHLAFELIHPFENGNGRTGRFLLNKILISNGLLPMIVFEENRQGYFNAIASGKSGHRKKYYKFMLEQYGKTIDEYWDNNHKIDS